jgi:hypothetical protein
MASSTMRFSASVDANGRALDATATAAVALAGDETLGRIREVVGGEAPFPRMFAGGVARLDLGEQYLVYLAGRINHAYTRLSEIYETWRISHTGNIYHRILYKERNGKWYPLDVLRNRKLQQQEHQIAEAIWEAFMTNMTGGRSDTPRPQLL